MSLTGPYKAVLYLVSLTAHPLSLPPPPDKLSGCRDDLKPTNLMRKSPSLESVIKAPGSLTGRTTSFSYNRPNSKLRWAPHSHTPTMPRPSKPQFKPHLAHWEWSVRVRLGRLMITLFFCLIKRLKGHPKWRNTPFANANLFFWIKGNSLVVRLDTNSWFQVEPAFYCFLIVISPLLQQNCCSSVFIYLFSHIWLLHNLNIKKIVYILQDCINVCNVFTVSRKFFSSFFFKFISVNWIVRPAFSGLALNSPNKWCVSSFLADCGCFEWLGSMSCSLPCSASAHEWHVSQFNVCHSGSQKRLS